MSAFKVGDRVRGPIGHAGRKEEGTVVKVDNADSIGVLPDEKRYAEYCCPGHPGAGTFRAERLTLIEPEPRFKVGDTVRVEFEGKVTFVHDDGYLTLNDDTGPGEIINPEHVVKVEPPFQPGDFVLEVATDRVFFVAKDGYVEVGSPGPLQREANIERAMSHDTGEYKRVEYARVPF